MSYDVARGLVVDDSLRRAEVDSAARWKGQHKPVEQRILVPINRDLPQGTVVLRGGRAITMKGKEVVDNAYVVIRNNRIVSVGPRGSAPPMPGWWTSRGRPSAPASSIPMPTCGTSGVSIGSSPGSTSPTWPTASPPPATRRPPPRTSWPTRPGWTPATRSGPGSTPPAPASFRASGSATSTAPGACSSAGCWEISFGLETGSDALLQAMDKAARVERSEQAVRWTHAAGIRTKGLFMLGYPGETPETIRATRAYAHRIPMDIMNLTKFTPYPGSPIYVDLYGTKIRPEDWRRMNGMNFVWSPDGISVAQLDRAYQRLLLGFYFRPRVIHHYLVLTLRRPTHLARVLRFLAGYLAAKGRSLLAGRRGLLVQEAESAR